MTGLDGCQWREDSWLCQILPTLSPLPWGPLDTSPNSLHPRTPEGRDFEATPGPTSLPTASCKELVLGGAGKKIKHPPSAAGCAVSGIPLSALVPQVSGLSFQGGSRGYKESMVGEGTKQFVARHKDTVKRLFQQMFVRWTAMVWLTLVSGLLSLVLQGQQT